MFQTFESHASPEQGPVRLGQIRQALRDQGLNGFIVPRSDAHHGEYVAPHDERLQWLTGFTGSAGFCIILPEIAGIFVDGRYRTQVRIQTDANCFTPVHWPETRPGKWIGDHLVSGTIGFDSWLHSAGEIEDIRKDLNGQAITLQAVENPIDLLWRDQPPPPLAPAFIQPDDLAGESHSSKRDRLARILRDQGEKAAVITQPDSLCWLLNIRGGDVPRTPVMHGFAILHDDASVDLFAEPAKLMPDVVAHLGDAVSTHAPDAFLPALSRLRGPVRIDKTTAPLQISSHLEANHISFRWGDDPCLLPKALKSPVEIAGAREAHLRDGAAMVEFLAWLDEQRPADLTEIAVVKALEDFRRATGKLHDISFDTICGSGPNGAVIHYRVTNDTDRRLRANEVLLVDSGAQYLDGTTDITRTIALGDPGDEARACFTRVLKGLIAISRLRWPRGLAGRDLDPLARYPLWLAGQDYDHGTGHGVGAFLSVHEGPQRLSRLSEVPLEPGMILSNEPGYYREGAFGIRLENLIITQTAPKTGDGRDHLSFETLTMVPLDQRMILARMLTEEERDWLNAYHAQILQVIGPRISDRALKWLQIACQPFVPQFTSS